VWLIDRIVALRAARAHPGSCGHAPMTKTNPWELPPSAYIIYVEDLTAGRDVHWTRWPRAFRPGFGG
jgi:hypothetical protein